MSPVFILKFWTSITRCEWGCAGDACQPKPENYTEPAEVVEEIVENSPVVKTLKVGESNLVTVGETEYELKIYDLNSEYVILRINDFNTEEVFEGNNLTYQDLTINVQAIFFQPYEGGTREVHYTQN